MNQSCAIVGCLSLLVLAVLTGCADPAADKPQAVVADELAPVTQPGADDARYVLGEGSSIGFVGSKVTGSHEGGFNAFEGEIVLPDGDPSRSSVRVTIDTRSLWADDDRLTGHLKSPDFFGVEDHPEAKFESTAVARDGDGYVITGNLDLHGVSKSISFPATIDASEDQVEAQAEFAIKRFDFNIEYKGRADDLIRDDVLIKLKLVAVPAEG